MSPFGKLYRGTLSPRDLPTKGLKGRGKAAISMVLALLSLTPTGCTVVHNGYSAMTKNTSWNDTVVVLRNRSHSAKSWHRRKHHFAGEKYNQDFCNGFRAGYEAVCGGSDGCTPAFPPSEYWSWEYQSGEGQARTSAWFTGYPHGVRAAEEEGAGNWHQIQMSPNMRNQLQGAKPVATGSSGSPLPAPSGYDGGVVPTGQPGLPFPSPIGEPHLIGPSPSDAGFGLPSYGVVPQVQ